MIATNWTNDAIKRVWPRNNPNGQRLIPMPKIGEQDNLTQDKRRRSPEEIKLFLPTQARIWRAVNLYRSSHD